MASRLTTANVLRMVLDEEEDDEIYFDGSDEDFGLGEEETNENLDDDMDNTQVDLGMETELDNVEMDLGMETEVACMTNGEEYDGDYEDDDENDGNAGENENVSGNGSESDYSDYSDEETDSNDGQEQNSRRTDIRLVCK